MLWSALIVPRRHPVGTITASIIMGGSPNLVRRKAVLSSHPLAEGHGARFVVDAADAETGTRLFRHDPFGHGNVIAAVRVHEWDTAMDEFSR
ncbi:hypothetical protein ACH47B_37535 [Rhodococcus sp. NPDC019627]|uniref:hypothetical protein n=1 Tax=unclassified Rhodococcus (in: high G+C Gram-positive bacteria) TaxID=192944 RepID=UPI00379AA626